jgi:putative thiamine transport system ATP-binding protein
MAQRFDIPVALHLQVDSLRSPVATLAQGLEITLPAGTVHTIMGPSGSGKSSLLAAVCGTLAPAMQFQGAVHVMGRRVDALPTRARRIALLYQDDLLFAHMTVQENLLFALAAGPQAARTAQVVQALDEVELGAFAQADPATLSGGQRARAALARALLSQPQALMLDEPFAKLDVALRQRMRALVFGAVARRGITALVVTHDPADIADAQRVTHLVAP